MKSTLIKGLIMTIVALIATAVTTTGLPDTLIEWQYFGITVAGTVFVYLGKNLFITSNSSFLALNIGDLVNGLVVAIGTGLSSFVAAAITTNPVNWGEIVTLMVSVAVGYLAKNLGSDGTVKK
jgi:hypothetical protein